MVAALGRPCFRRRRPYQSFSGTMESYAGTGRSGMAAGAFSSNVADPGNFQS